jgi:hypothetical protein
MTTAISEFVTLKSGLALPMNALRLAWNLEDRGFHLSIDGEYLVVEPSKCLTDADRVAIRYWKPQLMAMLTQRDWVM